MKIGNVIIDNPLFLAPMAGITDLVFRRLCKEQGCGVVYTEMISAKGLFYGSGKTAQLMEIDDREHPIGMQIFGSDPLIMAKMVEEISENNADFIDINMGCPAPKITKNGEGSALMKEPQLVKRIVSEVCRASSKPVTVKIRKGWDEESVNAVDIASIAEDAGAAAVTIHGRTREQFYSGVADWDIIKEVKSKVSIPVIGNGDIFTPQAAYDMKQYTKCDGLMVARGAQGNPWVFRDINAFIKRREILLSPSVDEKIDMAIRHLNMLVGYQGDLIAINEMRKHIAWYLKGLKGASKKRNLINQLNTVGDIVDALNNYRYELKSQ